MVRENLNLIHISGAPGKGGRSSFIIDFIRLLDEKGFNNVLVTTGETPTHEEAEKWKVENKIIKKPGIKNLLQLFENSDSSKTIFIWHDSDVYRYIPKKNKKHPGLKNMVFLQDFDWNSEKFPHPKYLRRADFFITSSTYEKNMTRDIPVPIENVAVIPKSVLIKRFNPNASPQPVLDRLHVPPEVSLIGTVARFDDTINYERLLQTMDICLNNFDDAEFLFVGDGPEREEFMKKVELRGMKHKALFTGFQDNIPQLFAAIDIYYHISSVDRLTYSVIEAIAVGKPIIAPNLSSVREFLTDGENGLFYKVEDPRAAFSLIDKLRKNPDLQTGMKTLNASYAEKVFALEKNIDKYSEIIEKLSILPDREN